MLLGPVFGLTFYWSNNVYDEVINDFAMTPLRGHHFGQGMLTHNGALSSLC